MSSKNNEQQSLKFRYKEWKNPKSHPINFYYINYWLQPQLKLYKMWGKPGFFMNAPLGDFQRENN